MRNLTRMGCERSPTRRFFASSGRSEWQRLSSTDAGTRDERGVALGSFGMNTRGLHRLQHRREV